MGSLPLIITIVLFIILLSYSIYLTNSVKLFNDRLKNLEKPKDDPGKNIISILEEIQEGSEKILNKTESFPDITEKLDKRISLCIQKIGISGVETFSSAEKKSDDTALALLNYHGDGIVISFNKDNIINIKSLEKGQSHSKLTRKEEEAIGQALN